MPVRRSVEVTDILNFRGAKTLTANLAATAISDNGNGTVRITTAAHGFVATVAKPIHMEIEGSINYDGMRLVVGAPSSTTLDIVAPFTAETPVGSGAETISFNIAPKYEFAFSNIEVTINTAPTTAEDLTIDLDSFQGASWDINIRTKSMLGLTSWDYAQQRDVRKARDKGDRIRFAYTNTDVRTLGIRVEYERL